MDTRRGCNAAPDEERWLFMGRDPCCPPSPEHRDDPGALFNEVERVVLLKVTALIALDEYQAAAATSSGGIHESEESLIHGSEDDRVESRLLLRIFSRSATASSRPGQRRDTTADLGGPRSVAPDPGMCQAPLRRQSPNHPWTQGATRTRPQHGRAAGAGALTSRTSKLSISDESSSDDDGCSSKDEQRLLAYKLAEMIFGGQLTSGVPATLGLAGVVSRNKTSCE
jgi:hypothetical protein